MSLGELMRRERERLKLTQEEMAPELCVSKSAISMYETGNRPVPDEVLARFTRKSPRLAIQCCFECSVGIFKIPYLDQADVDPATLELVLDEELGEALEAWRRVSLANKRSRDRMNAEDWAAYRTALVQLYDVITAFAHELQVAYEFYGVTPQELADEHLRKVVGRGLVSRQTKENGALASAYCRS